MMLYSDLARGVNIVNLFDFWTTIGTTENNVVPGHGMYEAVLQGLWEVGSFEDILIVSQKSMPRSTASPGRLTRQLPFCRQDVGGGAATLLGQPKGAKVGLFMSSAADIWKDNELDPTDSTNPVYTFGTNIRAVYVML